MGHGVPVAVSGTAPNRAQDCCVATKAIPWPMKMIMASSLLYRLTWPTDRASRARCVQGTRLQMMRMTTVRRSPNKTTGTAVTITAALCRL